MSWFKPAPQNRSLGAIISDIFNAESEPVTFADVHDKLSCKSQEDFREHFDALLQKYIGSNQKHDVQADVLKELKKTATIFSLFTVLQNNWKAYQAAINMFRALDQTIQNRHPILWENPDFQTGFSECIEQFIEQLYNDDKTLKQALHLKFLARCYASMARDGRLTENTNAVVLSLILKRYDRMQSDEKNAFRDVLQNTTINLSKPGAYLRDFEGCFEHYKNGNQPSATL